MKALVLCGGFGTRLGALCAERPKPLLEVGSRALVEHVLLRLAAARIEEVFVNLHFGADQLRERLGSGSRYGVQISYVEEPQLLGTAGTPHALRARCGADGLLVHYGDVISDHPLSELLERHRQRGGAATLVVHERPGGNSCAVLGEGDRVERFVERPSAPARAGLRSPWSFSGICVLTRECLDELPAKPGADLPRDLFPPLARDGRLFAQRHAGYRCAIDSPTRLFGAREAWVRGQISKGGA